MKKLLRIGALVATATLLTIPLAACGFAPSNPGTKSTEINLLVPSYDDATQGLWETVIKGFEKKYPNYTVKLEVESWDNLNDVVTTKIQANQAPDIMNGGPFAGFAADDLLYPTKDVVSAKTLHDFQDSFVTASSVSGVQYGAPLIASARALFVNTDLLSKAGIEQAPKTWDDLLDDATKISALGDGIAGYGMPLGSEEAQAESAMWFFGAGGTFGDEKKITIAGVPENLKAAEFMQKMIKAGATEADAGATDRSPLMDIFVQGKIGMQVGLPPTVGQIAKGNPSLKYAIVPMPTPDGSAISLGVADHLMAFKNDGKKKAAITAFLDYFYTSDVYIPWVQAEGFLPTTKSGAKALNDNKDLKPFLDLLPDAKFYPSTNPKWDATNAAFKSLMGELAQGKAPADVLAGIQAAADAG